MKVGLISDTHGLMRSEALAALRGCAHIIRAGDIGDAAILGSLGEIAPVTAHKPMARTEDGVLYVNPWSAGPRRFNLPISIGFLHIAGSSPTPELVPLS